MLGPLVGAFLGVGRDGVPTGGPLLEAEVSLTNAQVHGTVSDRGVRRSQPASERCGRCPAPAPSGRPEVRAPNRSISARSPAAPSDRAKTSQTSCTSRRGGTCGFTVGTGWTVSGYSGTAWPEIGNYADTCRTSAPGPASLRLLAHRRGVQSALGGPGAESLKVSAAALVRAQLAPFGRVLPCARQTRHSPRTSVRCSCTLNPAAMAVRFTQVSRAGD
jgi:hypothetical protein